MESHEEHLERIKLVRSVSAKTGVNLAIALDTKGPEIRLGTFKNDVETTKSVKSFIWQRQKLKEHMNVSTFNAQNYSMT